MGANRRFGHLEAIAIAVLAMSAATLVGGLFRLQNQSPVILPSDWQIVHAEFRLN
jgi:hypothetical protein